MSRKELLRWLKTILIAIIFALLIREMALAFYVVEGGSMTPTLRNGELVAVNKLVYSRRGPQAGEVVVFKNPTGNPELPVFIKRVIATAGDTVAIADGVVYVNGEPIEEEYIQIMTPGQMDLLLVEPGYIFVLGDNRYPHQSWDSRGFGPVLQREVIGRAEVVIFPLPHRLK